MAFQFRTHISSSVFGGMSVQVNEKEKERAGYLVFLCHPSSQSRPCRRVRYVMLFSIDCRYALSRSHGRPEARSQSLTLIITEHSTGRAQQPRQDNVRGISRRIIILSQEISEMENGRREKI